MLISAILLHGMLCGKMKTKYKYITTAALSVIVTFMISLGVDVSVDSVAYDQGYLPYSCDKTTVDDMMCYKLSRVGPTTGVNRNCYYNRDRGKKYKVCSTGWERIINVDDLNLSKICPTTTQGQTSVCPPNDCSICPSQIQYITKYVNTSCVQTCNGCGGGGSCKPCSEQECDTDSENAIVLAMIPNDDCTSTLNYYCSGIGKGKNPTCTNSEDLSKELLDDLLCW